MRGNGDVRIGVYVCHCGSNIAATVDVEAVTRYAEELPNVALAREYKYMCSDPGQELIRKDIDENKLNRVIVAACSPLLHEHTFRHATEAAGLNAYYFQMVNIREHCSWVHDDRERATTKAKDLIRAATMRIVHHEALEPRKVAIRPEVLVVGGGVAGIQAALTLAAAGKHVYLVEKDATIGGHMAKFDKTFPTLDCSMCILAPKMTAVKASKNITLWTCSDVTRVEGYVGNFKVTVRRRPRYVIEDLCVGCSRCIDECLFKEGKFPDEWNLGLSKRKPVYIPFPQAVPPVALIDPAACIQLKTVKCKMTFVEACGERKAIDFDQKAEEKVIEVGAIIVATGFRAYDPTPLNRYGYGRLKDVYTALEVERLLNASGPTGGNLVRRSDNAKPKSVAILHCVGSRDENAHIYCSRVCCMYSLKLAHLIKEKTGAEVFNCYIDIRAFGKGYEEFYRRLMSEGVQFIRGKGAEVTDVAEELRERGKLVVSVEDTLLSRIRRIPVDMVVLAQALEAGADAAEVRRMFNISCSADGFFLEKHPKLAPVNTVADGVFLAGCCQGAKDIPDTVAQAGAAAGEALALIDAQFMMMEPNTASVTEDLCSGCRTCLPLCPYQAITRDEQKNKAVINEVLCKGCGTCVASCPSAAISQKLFTDAQIFSEIQGVMMHE
ncbi:MAG: CoB--CoM heterodisulfide reductase iron-sulfur subunit A family protein [Candidatus Riflebacteria bacterium]|nr:CoB--CoM heterodisulfide reductase iron-sulfur subunit A family protein [Candidatus Riflebacteria bacterium]